MLVKRMTSRIRGSVGVSNNIQMSSNKADTSSHNLQVSCLDILIFRPKARHPPDS
ncbi:hypothetical protein AG1IA_06065 [Rhizoctonia solani AG-1 IA]|uniref:Uncharacterized protein n=1 Tax=Thanatephorus cucumeris (strain AG1-IA) TaxID=983506 RepID=L8WPJ5_THACA|nr:hypothetical protein AG1IA_06065 [Rhizoctonia solani AG-1 IA]